MAEDRWLKIIDDNGTTNVNDYISNFIFLEAKSSYPTSVEDSITIKGVDGELPSVASFSPFSLIVKFGLDGIDEKDINLMEQMLRNLFYRRKPYYVVTSDNPGKKFLVNNPDMNPDYADFSATRFDMTFSVKKGYSESLFPTDRLDLMSEYWDFSNGLIVDEDIKYNHNKNNFEIYNGSDDVITPVHRHYMKTEINIDAPNGFKLKNKSNATEFEYIKPIKSKDNLVLNGAHPFLNGKNCGIDTNWEFLTLNPGINKFEIIGDGAQVKNIMFSFNFIYR